MKLEMPRYADGIKTVVQKSFGGIDRREGLSEGAVRDLVGMTADKFPTLSSAPPRSRMKGAEEVYAYFESLTERWWQRQGQEGSYRDEMPRLAPVIEGVFDVADRIFYVVSAIYPGAELSSGGEGIFCVRCAVYDKDRIEVITSEAIFPYVRAGVRGVVFNSALVLWMDGADTPDSPDRVVSFSYSPAKEDGALPTITSDRLSLVFPAGISGVWHDLAEATTYLRCGVPLDGVREGDFVHITYTCSSELAEQFVRIRGIRTLEDGAWIITTDLDESLPESSGSLEQLEAGSFTHHATLQVERRVPQLEHIAVNRDRIWGTVGNEIYSCASCDSANWYRYDLSAGASFYAMLPSVSVFSAVCSYMGSVFFFTREGAYRMYGTTPEAFSLSEITCYGTAEGAETSFGVADGLMFYNSVYGTACFDGEGSVLVSREFGEEIPSCVCALGAGGKYYFSDGEYLYIRDVHSATWHKEEARLLRSMLNISGRVVLFFEDGQALYHRAEPWEEKCPPTESFAELGDFTDGCVFGSIPVEFTLRVRIGEGARLALFVSTPAGVRQEVWRTEQAGSYISTARVIAQLRCDSYRLRLEGEGDFQVYSIARSYIPCSGVFPH